MEKSTANPTAKAEQHAVELIDELKSLLAHYDATISLRKDPFTGAATGLQIELHGLDCFDFDSPDFGNEIRSYKVIECGSSIHSESM